MVNTSQAGDVTDKLVKQSWLQQVSLLCDQRLLCGDNILGGGRVCAEQPPVDEATVPEVGVLALLGGKAEHLLHQLLGVSRPLEEQLHNSSEELDLDLGVLIMEVVQEVLKKLNCVVNCLVKILT